MGPLYWVIATILVLGIVGVVLGINKKAVFYHGKLDVFVSCFTMFAGLIFLNIIVQQSYYAHYRWPLIILSNLIIFGYNLGKSIRYNNLISALCTFCGRLIMSVVCIFAIGELLDFGNSKDRTRNNIGSVLRSIAIITGSAVIVNKLINKEEILAYKQNKK